MLAELGGKLPSATSESYELEGYFVFTVSALVPISGGGTTLIFETDDHALWQLCDVGLGWTRYEQVGADWRSAEPFRDLLPARIRPRPGSTAPWEYDIVFGPKATLIVRLAPDRKNFTYRLRRKDRSRGLPQIKTS